MRVIPAMHLAVARAAAWFKRRVLRPLLGRLDAFELHHGQRGNDLAAIAAARWAVCQACPNLRRDIGTCSLCGCFMRAKVQFHGATCPAGKW